MGVPKLLICSIGERPISDVGLFTLIRFPEKAFQYNIIKSDPAPAAANLVTLAPNGASITFRTFVEIIFKNHEKTVQSWHLDGYSFAVAIEPGRWTPEKRKNYNLLDAVSWHTIQVFPNSWAAVMLTFDNAGMWNLRSELTERRYLGQQMYVSVLSPEKSLRDEYNIPDFAELCGLVAGPAQAPPLGRSLKF